MGAAEAKAAILANKTALGIELVLPGSKQYL